MEVLLQKTNGTLNELHYQMNTIFKDPTADYSELEECVRCNIEEVYENCKRLEGYVFKEPAHRKQAAKLKVDKIFYDIRHIETGFKSYLSKKRQREQYEREKEELLSTNFTTNAERHTKIAMDSLDHHDRLLNADKGIGEMLYTGNMALEQMKNQRSSLKGVRKRILDIGNTLGLSNTVMRMIDKRGTQDKWLVFVLIIITFVVMVLTLKYLT